MPVFDVQHHYVPRELALKAGWTPGEQFHVMKGTQRAVTLHDRVVDLDWHVRDMDTGGLDVAVLSSFLGWDGDLETCRFINDDMAKLTVDYSGRFRGFAHIPTQDPAAGPGELDRAIDELGLAGVTVMTRVNGRSIDDPSLHWFWELVQARHLAVFVHPVLYAGNHFGTEEYELERIIAREFDLVTSATRVIASGLLDKFPELTFIFGHYGGGIAAVKDRIYAKGFRFGTKLQRTFLEYFDDLYFDMAGFEGRPGAMHSALTGIRPERLCFATDYPQDFTGVMTETGVGPEGIATYVADVRALDLPDATKEGILGGNAIAILNLP